MEYQIAWVHAYDNDDGQATVNKTLGEWVAGGWEVHSHSVVHVESTGQSEYVPQGHPPVHALLHLPTLGPTCRPARVRGPPVRHPGSRVPTARVRCTWASAATAASSTARRGVVGVRW